jgi:hypothetical protein
VNEQGINVAIADICNHWRPGYMGRPSDYCHDLNAAIELVRGDRTEFWHYPEKREYEVTIYVTESSTSSAHYHGISKSLARAICMAFLKRHGKWKYQS